MRRFEYSSIFSGKCPDECLDAIEEIQRRLHGEAADAEVAGHHALAGYRLKEPENLFALAEGVEEDGEGANVHGVRAEPDEVRIEAAELGEQNANPLGALGDFEAEKLFDGQAVAEIVGERIEIVDAIGERNDLLIELGLAGFLDAGVQIADLRPNADDDFAVDLNDQAQHAVRGRVLRAHVEDHAPLAGGFRRRGARGRVRRGFRSSAVSLHRVVLAQGVALPVVGHHDAAQVGMAGKANAEEIEDFALVDNWRRPRRA